MKRLMNKLMNCGWPAVLMLALLTAFSVASCQDDEDGGGAPVIHYVRVTDPALADSTFTDAQPGTMIAVIGENLGGLQAVYINGYEVSINSTLATSTCIILTIPTVDEENPDLFQLVGTNPDLPAEIRVVTNHGTATYAFHVLSPAPYITRLAVDYPVDPGEELTIVGGNFYELQKIYFSEDSVTVSQEVTEYTVNNDYDEITFNAPSTVIEEGFLFVVCYTDTAVVEFIRNAPEPIVTGISSTMPVVGSEVTITGQNFVALTGIDVNGEFTIPAEDIEVSTAFDELTFIMPQAPTQSGTLAVSTVGGTAEIEDFYPVEYVVLDYDNVGWFSWGGGAALFTADGTAPPFVGTGSFSGFTGSATQSWWWLQTINNAVYTTDAIPGGTSVANLELQFECYIEQPFEGPVMQIAMGGNTTYSLTNYVPVSAFTGEMETGQWMQVSVPLSQIVEESTWQEFVNRGNSELGIYMTYPTAGEEMTVTMFFDNFRVVPIED